MNGSFVEIKLLRAIIIFTIFGVVGIGRDFGRVIELHKFDRAMRLFCKTIQHLAETKTVEENLGIFNTPIFRES